MFRKIKQTFRRPFRSLQNILNWMLEPRKHPWPFIPIKLLGKYTMNGKMKIKYLYLNDAYPPDKPLIYRKEEIDSLIEKIKCKSILAYGKTDLWLYQALEKFPVKGKEVAIMGSTRPTYESICIFFGGKPTTIEYNTIVSEDDRLKTITVAKFDKSPMKFDMAFSISSFEHDGLGRYGDQLNPDGDLLAMAKMKSILKPNGILFLAIPVGRDVLVWNAHRIYGINRLPLLLKNWKCLDAYGYSEDLLGINNELGEMQPVFVLMNI